MDHKDLIQQTLDYMEENLTAEVLPLELADAAGYSRSHFSRIFRKETGLTVSQYLNRRKLIHAAYEISGGMSVVDAALRYGFATKAGFYKAFVREFGMSPAAYTETHALRPPHPIRLRQEEHIMLTRKQLEKLLAAHWGIDDPVTDYYWPGTGVRADDVWNVGEDLCLKMSGNIPAAEKAAILAEKLYQSLPGELPVRSLAENLVVKEGEAGFVLYRKGGEPFLSRELIASPELVSRAGRQVARMDRILTAVDDICCPKMDLYSHLSDWAVPAVHTMGGMEGKFRHWYLHELDTLLPQLPVQLIHRDPNASNLLKSGGFRGFELAQQNVRLFDPCYTATSVLSETWSDSAAREQWFDLLHRLLSAYDAENPLTEAEKAAVPMMVFSIQLICAAYFSGTERFKELYETNLGMLRFLAENRERLRL